MACVTENKLVRVCISDEGIGISEFDREKLFSRFYRVERKETRQVQGFGIGLYLSYEIIARHNGNIWVENNHPKGSKFNFILPTL